MKKTKFILIILITIVMTYCSNSSVEKPYIILETQFGRMVIKLYEDTPLHLKNFKQLASDNFYDGLLFHRVIKDFMIQAGDPDSKTATKGQQLGTGGPGYTVDAEIVPTHFHKKGALSAARKPDQINPTKESSGSQFYIVQGRTFTDEELDKLEENMNQQKMQPLIIEYLQRPANEALKMQFIEYQQKKDNENMAKIWYQLADSVIRDGFEGMKIDSTKREVYKTVGGTPFLDNEYTVFGEVVEGLEIIDKIAEAKTDNNNRPFEDIKIESLKLYE